ncbi:V-type ATP synthase subunit I [Neptunomonas sp.]|uniref:V-type ATP synthase subunit I n=1 Tax=Neptunomonas sp. TaxID=1971898 RepID=UPI0035656A23
MSIATLKKLTLIGEINEKSAIMEQFQAFGLAHLITLSEQTIDQATDATICLREALSYLISAPYKRRRQIPSESIELSEVIDRVIKNKHAREDVIDEIELITARQKELSVWGDFEFPPLDELNQYRVWLYLVPLSKEALLDKVELPWIVINKDHKSIYLVVIAVDEPDEGQVPFPRAHIGPNSLSCLAKLKNDALVRLEDLNAERQSLTRWIMPLTLSLNDTINAHELKLAEQLVWNSGDFFVLQSWLPDESRPAFEAWAQGLPVAFQLDAPAANELPPTLLKNDSIMGGGEEAVSFFQLPGYRSWDPSIVIFFSFSLFFSMIMADAGYALILGGILLICWRKLSGSETTVRIRNLWLALVVAAFGYGMLVGSYFGITPPDGTLLSHLHVINMNDFSSMMKLSIGAGVLHLVIANSMVAWGRRDSLVALSSVGWVLSIIGAFTLWLSYMRVTDLDVAGTFSVKVVIAGILLILLFSGERKLDSVKNSCLQLFDGFTALYSLSKAFGDVLSYMRLFALGLSSASLAVTFNDLAVEARDSVSAGGFILFALIIVLGHGLNFVLGVMSGVIHGLRLNLLEFYNWGVKGEGYPFKAFKKRGE